MNEYYCPICDCMEKHSSIEVSLLIFIDIENWYQGKSWFAGDF